LLVPDVADHHDRASHAILCGRSFKAEVTWFDPAKPGQHRQLMDAPQNVEGRSGVRRDEKSGGRGVLAVE